MLDFIKNLTLDTILPALMTLLVVPCMYEIISKKTIRIVDESELELLDD